MRAQFLAYIFRILKKSLSQLARRSANLLFSFLSSLRRFAVCRSKLRDRDQGCKAGSRFSTGDLMRSQGDVAGDDHDVPIYPSLLPPDPMSLEVAGGPSSPSDDPYSRTHSRQNLRQNTVTEISLLELDPATRAYPSAAGSNQFSSDSVSSLHPSRDARDSQSFPPSPRIPYGQKGKGIDPAERGSKENSVRDNRTFLEHPLQPYTSLGSSSPFHELVSGSQQRTPSMNSLISKRTGRSSALSLVVSESGRSELRKHVGPVHYLPGSAHSSRANLLRGSPHRVSVPLGLPVQAVPASDSGIDPNVRFIAPPGSDGEPGSEVPQYDELPVIDLVPCNIKRYERKIRLPEVSDLTIPPGTNTCPAPKTPLPPEWISIVHPEGCRYFVNRGKRTFTEINIYDDELRELVEYGIEVLLNNLNLIPTCDELDMDWVDLVIEPKFDDKLNGIVLGYYFINHHSRSIFWLNKFNAKGIISNLQGVQSISHIWFAIQAQYWKHWDYFPNLCPIAEDLIDEVKDMLIYAKCDHLSSKQSSAVYDVATLTEYLSVVDKLKVYPSVDQGVKRSHAAIVIGRIMHEISHNALINFHGEDCARLNYEQTVHGWKYAPSVFMVVLAPLLFLEPVTQVRELHKIFADNITRNSRWNTFSSKLKAQLNASNLLATVLLNANVAFLGTHSVDTSGRSAIQMASYMSLVTSLGSIVLGLFFVSQDRISGESTAAEAVSFLGKLCDKTHGLEKLAIIYSLPMALLVWGIIFFFAAFSIHWWTSGDTTPRAVVGSVTLFVFMMIANSIIRTKERELWWPTNQLLRGIGLEPLLHLASNAWKRGLEFIGMKRAKRNAPPSIAGGLSQANTEVTRSRSTIPRHPNPSIPATPTASVHSIHQLNGLGDRIMLPPPHELTRPSPLSSMGSLPHIREDSPTISQAETPCQPDRTSLRFHSTSPYSCSASEMTVGAAIIPSEHEGQTAVVGTDSGALISPDPLHIEEMEGMDYVVEEPEELENGSSTPPPPKIVARSATNDVFRYAPPAAQGTLQDGHDTELVVATPDTK